MTSHLLNWPRKLVAAKEAAKEAAKATGQIVSDVTLSVIISEKLLAAGLQPVERGAVNHWLKGRRQPNVSQFIALCETLSVSPGEILNPRAQNIIDLPAREPGASSYAGFDDDDLRIISLLERSAINVRKLALAAALGVLEKSNAVAESQKNKRPR
jgi:hypothetical protein